jgi:hypothetical protein
VKNMSEGLDLRTVSDETKSTFSDRFEALDVVDGDDLALLPESTALPWLFPLAAAGAEAPLRPPVDLWDVPVVFAAGLPSRAFSAPDVSSRASSAD